MIMEVGASGFGWTRRDAFARASLMLTKAASAVGVQSKGAVLCWAEDSIWLRRVRMAAPPGTSIGRS